MHVCALPNQAYALKEVFTLKSVGRYMNNVIQMRDTFIHTHFFNVLRTSYDSRQLKGLAIDMHLSYSNPFIIRLQDQNTVYRYRYYGKMQVFSGISTFLRFLDRENEFTWGLLILESFVALSYS